MKKLHILLWWASTAGTSHFKFQEPEGETAYRQNDASDTSQATLDSLTSKIVARYHASFYRSAESYPKVILPTERTFSEYSIWCLIRNISIQTETQLLYDVCLLARRQLMSFHLQYRW